MRVLLYIGGGLLLAAQLGRAQQPPALDLDVLEVDPTYLQPAPYLTQAGDTGDTGEPYLEGDPVPGVTTDELVAGFEERLTLRGGCAEVLFWAANREDTVALHFWTERSVLGPAGPTTWVWSLPDPEVRLEVELGAFLTEGTCGRPERHDLVVDRTWDPIGGTAVLTVRPNAVGGPRATLTLAGVTLAPRDGGPVTVLDSAVWTEVPIGD